MNVNIAVYVSTVSRMQRCSSKGILSKDKLKILLLEGWNWCYLNIYLCAIKISVEII